MIYRDLKPENMVCDRSSRACLLTQCLRLPAQLIERSLGQGIVSGSHEHPSLRRIQGSVCATAVAGVGGKTTRELATEPCYTPRCTQSNPAEVLFSHSAISGYGAPGSDRGRPYGESEPDVFGGVLAFVPLTGGPAR